MRCPGFIILSLLCIFLSAPLWGQQTKRICDTIYYEYQQEKIIIPVTVNGKKVKYLVDTGGRTGTMWEDALSMNVEASGTSVNVSDLNGEKQSHQQGILKDVFLSEHFKIDGLETMVLPEMGFFKELGIVGMLGADAFSNCVLTFDHKHQIMVINYPYRPMGLKISDGVALKDNMSNHVMLDVQYSTTAGKVMFDTGAHGFLLISQNDFESFKESGDCIQTAEAYGINGIGMAGLSKPTKFQKGYVKELTFFNKKFLNVGIITNPISTTILGVDILKHGKVVVDYLRRVFYFFPYASDDVDMGGAPKTWNVSILPANERFEITAIWGSMKDKVVIGEQVLNINGVDLKGFPMSQGKIEELMNGIEGNESYIIVNRGGKEIKVKITKE